jgi:transcriptional regulator with XRE-family HTH domain
MPDAPDPPLGAELRERREARGWSQADVADRLDVTHNAVAAWENNHCGATDEHAAALVALLGTSDRRLSLVERRRRD